MVSLASAWLSNENAVCPAMNAHSIEWASRHRSFTVVKAAAGWNALKLLAVFAIEKIAHKISKNRSKCPSSEPLGQISA